MCRYSLSNRCYFLGRKRHLYYYQVNTNEIDNLALRLSHRSCSIEPPDNKMVRVVIRYAGMNEEVN